MPFTCVPVLYTLHMCASTVCPLHVCQYCMPFTCVPVLYALYMCASTVCPSHVCQYCMPFTCVPVLYALYMCASTVCPSHVCQYCMSFTCVPVLARYFYPTKGYKTSTGYLTILATGLYIHNSNLISVTLYVMHS